MISSYAQDCRSLSEVCFIFLSFNLTPDLNNYYTCVSFRFLLLCITKEHRYLIICFFGFHTLAKFDTLASVIAVR